MTEEQTPKISVSDVPDPISELRAIVKEQQQIILKQNDAIKDLSARMTQAEKMAAAAPVPAEPEPVKEAPSPQDAAYEAMLAEWGIKKEE